MSHNKKEKDGITVLVVEPLKEPYIKTISDSLKSLQAEVGGSIDAIYPFEDPAALVYHSDGKYQGLMPNRRLYDDDGQACDYIAGTFLIAGLGEEDFCSLSEKQIAKYMKQYRIPERFPSMGKGAAGVKSPERKSGKRNRTDEGR